MHSHLADRLRKVLPLISYMVHNNAHFEDFCNQVYGRHEKDFDDLPYFCQKAIRDAEQLAQDAEQEGMHPHDLFDRQQSQGEKIPAKHTAIA